jgi:hypothetical protein
MSSRGKGGGYQNNVGDLRSLSLSKGGASTGSASVFPTVFQRTQPRSATASATRRTATM